MSGVVTRCRDFTRQALSDWQWIPPDEAEGLDEQRWAVAEDVLLLVSEVVTNACLHGGGPSELVLHCAPDRLRIEVTDGNPEPPRPHRRGDPALPGGHGLVVLETLTRSWGSLPAGFGKTVWAEVPAPPPSRRVRPEGRH
ncbi:ATP-binding protein [Streptomyces sp. NPDC048603]|uniref:ATP-binding protein n=1 Tax=Streptomyces sp. NPDC048603 TaxID=3365577 RepID=UPI003717A48C